jgi:hypothetical protein
VRRAPAVLEAPFVAERTLDLDEHFADVSRLDHDVYSPSILFFVGETDPFDPKGRRVVFIKNIFHSYLGPTAPLLACSIKQVAHFAGAG